MTVTLGNLRNPKKSFILEENFDHFVTGDRWTAGGDAGGSAAVGDAAGGRMTITTDGDDNDEYWLASTAELLLPAANKPICIEFGGQYTEANTDDANIYIGAAQEAGADLMVDDGAGPATTLDGFGFYKVDGETRWRVVSSNATSQTKTETDKTAGGSSFFSGKIEVIPISSADAEVRFWLDTNGGVDFQQVREQGANPRTPNIKHTLALSGLAEMHIVAYAKAGGANAEALVLRYVNAYQLY